MVCLINAKKYLLNRFDRRHNNADNSQSRAEQSRVLRYDYLRVILVVLVVLSHCSYYDIITPFGGINYQSMMLTSGISDTKMHWAIKIVSNYLYSFHMPAFFALSGCLFWKQMELQKWTLSSLVVKKSKRLILPLLTTWIFWNIPIKYISGYYHGVPFSKVLLQLIFPNRVYLWYLESLFLVFIIVYLIARERRATRAPGMGSSPRLAA
ncbi:MAG: acyltransferase [Oscillospiraceae bacterium]|nr:acyltransferase [Oscillospiraceae bacterium]